MAIKDGTLRIAHVRGIMEAVVQPVKALFNPLDWVPRFVERKRWVVPVVLLALTSAFAGFSFASRWNGEPSTIQALSAKDELKNLTEQELVDKVQTAQRIAIVAGIFKGIVILPLGVLGLAAALKVLAWLFQLSALFGKCVSAAAIALFPAVIFNAIYAVCALKAPGLSDSDALNLVPSNLSFLAGAATRASKLLRAIDFFNLWSTGILALSFSAASGMSKRKSLAVALVLYAIYVGVFLIGLPGMAGAWR